MTELVIGAVWFAAGFAVCFIWFSSRPWVYVPHDVDEYEVEDVYNMIRDFAANCGVNIKPNSMRIYDGWSDDEFTT